MLFLARLWAVVVSCSLQAGECFGLLRSLGRKCSPTRFPVTTGMLLNVGLLLWTVLGSAFLKTRKAVVLSYWPCSSALCRPGLFSRVTSPRNALTFLSQSDRPFMLRWTKSVEYKSFIGLFTLWWTKSSSKIKLTLPFTQTWRNTEFRCLVTESGTGFLGRRAVVATSALGNTRVTSATSSLKSVSRSWAEYSLCTSLPPTCRIIRLTSSRTAQALREAVTSDTLAHGMIRERERERSYDLWTLNRVVTCKQPLLGTIPGKEATLKVTIVSANQTNE